MGIELRGIKCDVQQNKFKYSSDDPETNVGNVERALFFALSAVPGQGSKLTGVPVSDMGEGGLVDFRTFI
jgi:hypothetical protein